MGRIPFTGFQLVAQETFTTGVLKPVPRPGPLRPRPARLPQACHRPRPRWDGACGSDQVSV